jgi:recombinational DNA repair protein (RecF pathway)
MSYGDIHLPVPTTGECSKCGWPFDRAYLYLVDGKPVCKRCLDKMRKRAELQYINDHPLLQVKKQTL